MIFYKGVYCAFYNRLDSYSENMGAFLVIMLKMEDYSKWGEESEKQLVHGNFEIRRFEDDVSVRVTDNDLTRMKEEGPGILQYVEEESKKFITLYKWDIKESWPGRCTTLETSFFVKMTRSLSDIEKIKDNWMYVIIDLDNNIFRVIHWENAVEFKLNDIPLNWIKIVHEKCGED